MKAVLGFLTFAAVMQIIFDVMMFDHIVHGEVAWRWLQPRSAAFMNSPENYPGYYCGQNDCALHPEPGISGHQ
jgi:hypothetical protein